MAKVLELEIAKELDADAMDVPISVMNEKVKRHRGRGFDVGRDGQGRGGVRHHGHRPATLHRRGRSSLSSQASTGGAERC